VRGKSSLSSESDPGLPGARFCPAETAQADTLGSRMSVSPPARAIPDNLADLVGNTPMVRLTRVAPNCGAELIGKLEAHNPAGSVKDRIGVAMIEAAEAEGRIEPGRNTIVESTSGNTGIALAMVCAAKGYDLVITMPQGMSREREKLLRLYGAEVVWVESMGGMNEAVEEARRICRERGNCYVPNQFSNPANPEAHRRTTAEEIWRDMDGRVDVFVAPVGTGGTITGCGERLKEHNSALQVVAVEPAASPVLSGGRPGPHKIDGIGPGFVPQVLNRDVIDEIVPVEDEDAIETARLCARREGINAGISAGASVWAAVQVGTRAEMRGKRIVAILPDSGDRYISTPFFAP
jgi:cysteine synthase A